MQTHQSSDKRKGFGLKVNLDKTLYMSHDELAPSRPIIINSHPLSSTNSFKYLGSKISINGLSDDDTSQRIAMAWTKWRSI